MRGVLVPIQKKYAMPNICCACGMPAEKRWLPLKAQSMEWTGKREITLRLPLCQDCAKLRSRNLTGRFFGGALGLIVGVLVLVAAGSLLNQIETEWLAICIPLSVVTIFAAIGLVIFLVGHPQALPRRCQLEQPPGRR